MGHAFRIRGEARILERERRAERAIERLFGPCCGEGIPLSFATSRIPAGAGSSFGSTVGVDEAESVVIGLAASVLVPTGADQ